MLNKKVTRKEFLTTALSIAGLVVMSKVPSVLKKSSVSNSNVKNSYGNHSYGGSKKNA